MAYVATEGKFHIALDGVGLLLQGSPASPSYRMDSAPVYGTRFASGDRDYNDLSQWWYLIQTDWGAGVKDSQNWLDDAKHYFSTNIDTWSEPGGIKLCRDMIIDEDFTEDVTCGANVEIAGTTYQVIGTDQDGSSRPHVYRASQGTGNTWTDLSTTTIGTNQNTVSQISSKAGTMWVSTIGAGNTWVIMTYNGTTWTDQSAYMHSVQATQTGCSRTHCQYQGVMYIFSDAPSSDYHALVKTSVTTPSSGANYTLVFEQSNDDGLPVASCVINGIIYYILYYSGRLDLWAYSIAGATRTKIRTFKNASCRTYGDADKLLVDYNGILMITIPSSEIWTYDGSNLTRIYRKDVTKNSTLNGSLFFADSIDYGCIVAENKCWWGNLMYDGTNFHNTFKFAGDGTTAYIPVFSDLSEKMWFNSSADDSQLYVTHPSNWSVYKGADEKNYLIMSNYDKVSGVDKLPFSLTILFKPLVSGQSIEIEYFLGEMTSSPTWVSLGTASASLDGTTVGDKTFFFPVGTTFKKIWFRVKLEGDTTNTPTLTDFVMEFLPMTNYKKQWTMNINCADEVKRLDGSLVETTARELKSRIERMWMTKSVLDFQDLDYATTLLNGAISDKTATTITVDSTASFPEQGRFRVDDEEVLYTGKTSTTFTGCIRGARGTRATTHSDNAVLNNAYRVLINSISEQVPILLEDKNVEYVVGLNIREA